MKCAEVFSRRAVRIPSIIQSNRPDRQFVTQSAAERVTHVVHARFLGSGKQIAGIEKERALKLSVNWKGVLDIEDGVEFAADWISFGIVRAEIAFAKTSHAGGAAVKKSLVDR